MAIMSSLVGWASVPSQDRFTGDGFATLERSAHPIFLALGRIGLQMYGVG